MGPLFGALPGGPELLIVLVVFLLMLSVPLAVAVGLFLLGRWSADRDSDATEERIATLQARVDELEAQLQEANGTDSASEPEAGTESVSDRDAETDATD